nr:hypothetical protein CFP56_38772 [Quercus suber]
MSILLLYRDLILQQVGIIVLHSYPTFRDYAQLTGPFLSCLLLLLELATVHCVTYLKSNQPRHVRPHETSTDDNRIRSSSTLEGPDNDFTYSSPALLAHT